MKHFLLFLASFIGTPVLFYWLAKPMERGERELRAKYQRLREHHKEERAKAKWRKGFWR